MMLFIESLHRCYYCPLKDNRLVDDSCGVNPYRHVDSLIWDEYELAHGKTIKIKNFPKMHKVQVFRVVVSTHRTDFVVTNDLSQDSTSGTHQVCGWRWKIEQFHREAKRFIVLSKACSMIIFVNSSKNLLLLCDLRKSCI